MIHALHTTSDTAVVSVGKILTRQSQMNRFVLYSLAKPATQICLKKIGWFKLLGLSVFVLSLAKLSLNGLKSYME